MPHSRGPADGRGRRCHRKREIEEAVPRGRGILKHSAIKQRPEIAKRQLGKKKNLVWMLRGSSNKSARESGRRDLAGARKTSIPGFEEGGDLEVEENPYKTKSKKLLRKGK